MLRLAGPVVLARAWLDGHGRLVDTVFVGRLGFVPPIGAVSLGNASSLRRAPPRHGVAPGPGHPGVAGVRSPADARSATAGRRPGGRNLCLILCPLVMLLLFARRHPALGKLGVHPDVLGQAPAFLKALPCGHDAAVRLCGLSPLLAGHGPRQAGDVRLITCHLIERRWRLDLDRRPPRCSLRWALPDEAGLRLSPGSNTAPAASSSTPFTTTCGIRPACAASRSRPHLAEIARPASIGFPAAVHVTLEVGVPAPATTLAALLDPVALAAHTPHRALCRQRHLHDSSRTLFSSRRAGSAKRWAEGEPIAAGHARLDGTGLGTAAPILRR